MSESLPRKVFPVPLVDSPISDIYKQLKEANETYPINGIKNEQSWLPDFSRAVEMQSNIYRVNVPGYFFRIPGPTGVLDNSHKSGLVIGRYNHLMNCVSQHVHKFHYSPNFGGTWRYAAEHGQEYVEKCVVPGIQLDQIYPAVGTMADFWNIELSDVNKGVYDLLPSTSSYPGIAAIQPSMMIGSYACYVAILANQRECPENKPNNSSAAFQRDYALNYFVSTGDSGTGGIANNLIPIIPGVATTKKPTGEYGNSSCVYTSAPDCCVVPTTTTRPKWICDALSETHNAAIAVAGGIVGGASYCFKSCTYCGDTGELIQSDCVLEAKGTYVYYYHDSGNTDKFFFIPAKTASTTIKPITKIRSIAHAYSCNYEIPSANYDMGTSVTGDVFCVCHAQAVASYPTSFARISGGVITTPWSSITDGYGKQTADVECSITMHAHATPMDEYFYDIFTHAKVEGFSDKFVAQDLNLQAWPGTTTGSNASVCGQATHLMLDPLTNGE